MKSRENELETVKTEAITQVKGYLSLDELAEYPDLVTYLVMIVGEECRYLERVSL